MRGRWVGLNLVIVFTAILSVAVYFAQLTPEKRAARTAVAEAEPQRNITRTSADLERDTTLPAARFDAPRAFAHGTPNKGVAPLTVRFRGRGETRLGVVTRYRWDFNGDGEFDALPGLSLPDETPTTAMIENTYDITYDDPGIFNAVLEVTDSSGQISTDRCRIEVLSPGSETARTSALEILNVKISDNTLDIIDDEIATIETDLRVEGRVRMIIRDAYGGDVRILVDEQREAGSFQDTWDGCDDTGATVAHGVYFVIVTIEHDGQTSVVDLTKTTGGTRYVPRRDMLGGGSFGLPSVFKPFENDLLKVTFYVPEEYGASEIQVFVGHSDFLSQSANDTRIVTLLSRVVFGAGKHSIFWDGLDENWDYSVPSEGGGFLVGMFAFTLPDNAIFVESAPVLSNVIVDPVFLKRNTQRIEHLKVRFDLNRNSDIHLTVLHRKSRAIIRQIHLRDVSAGAGRSLDWDGLTSGGELAPQGDYRLRVEAIDSLGSTSLPYFALARVITR